MTAKKHLTQSGLEKIVSIKGALNKGLSEKLLLAFPDVKIISRPEFLINKTPLNPHWISGFTAGEGSFIFSISDKTIRVSYSIALHSREEPLLLRIKEFFDSKCNVRFHGANSLQFTIQGISELNTVIISHFVNYPLNGNKLYNFNIWVKIVELLANNAHQTEEGRVKLRELSSILNK